MIEYDGNNSNEIRHALDSMKNNQTVRIGAEVDGVLRLDSVWPDGQVSEGRWHLRVGDSLDPETGATYGKDGKPVDDAEVFGVGLPR